MRAKTKSGVITVTSVGDSTHTPMNVLGQAAPWDNPMCELSRLPFVGGVMKLFWAGLLLFTVAGSTAALADGAHERTQFGHDIVVGANDEVGDATCFGCSVRIRGHVTGDVTTFGGSVIVEDTGEVAGDTTTFGGNVRLSRATKINGDLTVFGGRIRRDPEAMVHGDVTNLGGPIWLFLIFGLPLILLGAFIALVVWLIRRLLRPSVPAAA
jgi:hypothetical protein